MDDGAESAVRHAYDRWSVSYDADHNATRDLDAMIVRRANLATSDADVLEVGCGTGKNTVVLAENARSVIAMDFSDGMLARARDRVRNPAVEFIRHDIRHTWPVESNSRDLVIGNLVLEHVASVDVVFTESARVLRPGGVLFLCELHPFRQWQGGQAHFTDITDASVVVVPAFVHTVSEYVNAGIGAGLVLRELGEWLEADAVPAALPRLLSVSFVKP